MRIPWALGRPELPEGVRAALSLEPGERVLSWTSAADATTVVATTTHLCAVPTAADPTRRPWHLVDSGVWDNTSATMTITWVDAATPGSWVMEEPGDLPETLRERVQASVVIAENVEVGVGRSARVVIRKNLKDGSLVGQTILGGQVRRDDPAVREAAAAALAALREQVGLG